MDPNTLKALQGAAGGGGYSGDIAVVFQSTPYISVYPWDSGFGTKYSDPSTLPTATSVGRGVAFTPDGADIAVTHWDDSSYWLPSISVYRWSSGFGTKYSNPSTPVNWYTMGCCFSPAAA